jgi:hypothetical protein
MNKQEFNKKCSKFLGYNHFYPYFDNWNWIMQVINKIETIHDDFHGYFGVHINSNSCTIQGTKLRTEIGNVHPAYSVETIAETKLEATIISIDKFLDWHQTIQTTTHQ